jgi:type I restriction enzyme S subunit
MNVKEAVIEDVCDFVGGSQPPKEVFVSEFKEGYIRLVQTRDYKTDDFPTYIPIDKAKKFCNKQDVMIGRYGPPIFQICRGIEGAYNVALMKAVPKPNILNDYLYYLLKQESIFTYVDRLSLRTGGQTGVDLYSLNQYPVLLPDLPYQQYVVNVLKSLDDKIELNNRINAELEAMAKTLYDYWFVQFDFPDQHGKPYKSSGGKMVWNEKLKREIPDGWKCYELSKLISRISTGLNPRKNFVLGNGTNYYVTIKNLDDGKIFLDEKCDKIDDEALKKINKRSDLKAGDILFTSIEPVGTTYLIQEKPENWNINESVFTLRPNYDLVTSEYAYLLLSSKEIKTFTKNVSAGSIHKGVRIGVLNTFKVAYGNKNIILEFSKKLQPTLKEINNLNKENQQLAELRDWLLPMLMNGQVTVENISLEE